MNKCVFLDRDGVINEDNVNYTYKVEAFKVLPGVVEALQRLKKAGYLLIVVTNQSGIAKGIYKHEDVALCHNFFQEHSAHLIDRYYYSPYHGSRSESLSRKPDTLMFEKAIAKYNIDIQKSWMIGDRVRDMVPANKMGIRTILLPETEDYEAESDFRCKNILDACELILKTDKQA